MKLTEEKMSIIGSYMDDEIREEIHSEWLDEQFTPEEFILRYLERDPEFAQILRSEFGLTAEALRNNRNYSAVIEYNRDELIAVIREAYRSYLVKGGDYKLFINRVGMIWFEAEGPSFPSEPEAALMLNLNNYDWDEEDLIREYEDEFGRKAEKTREELAEELVDDEYVDYNFIDRKIRYYRQIGD